MSKDNNRYLDHVINLIIKHNLLIKLFFIYFIKYSTAISIVLLRFLLIQNHYPLLF